MVESAKSPSPTRLISSLKCPKCGYEWPNRTDDPKECPRCKGKLNHQPHRYVGTKPPKFLKGLIARKVGFNFSESSKASVRQVLIYSLIVMLLAPALALLTSQSEVVKASPDTDYLWISDGGDLIYQVTLDDPETIVDSHDFGTSSPFGVEESDGYIFFVDHATDTLYKKLWSDKSDVDSWLITTYSASPRGLAYDGEYFWVADSSDDQMYKVDPSNPTTYVAMITYTGINAPEGVGWNSDNNRLLVADSGTDLFYSFDVSGVGLDQGLYELTPDWSFAAPGAYPVGIVWDGNYFWTIDDGTNLLYKHYDNGDVIQSYNPPGADPQGLACSYTPAAAEPGKPVLISPENQHSTYDNTPTFVWENGSDATSHRLVIDNSQNFDDGENIYDNASAWDNSGTAIENELPVNNYWWKICATNAEGDNWSENIWTFEVMAGAWNLIETWTGTIEAPVAWQLVETWDGTVEAFAQWNLIETWIGTIEAFAVWNLIETWTGNIKAYAEWQLIETWTGTIEAPLVNIAPVVENVYITDMDNVTASDLTPQTQYKFWVEVRDNDTLADIENVTLVIYLDNEDLPDNAENHYTFRWTRDGGFEEVGNDLTNYNIYGPTTIATVTNIESTWQLFQRGNFYAKNLFWVIYCDGENFIHKTSADGVTWSNATVLRAGVWSQMLSIHFDGTYVHYAHASHLADNTPIYYRRGLPNTDGSFTWSDSEQIAVAGVENVKFVDPTITLDSSNCPWIGYRYWQVSPSNNYPYVTKSTLDNGTWSTAPDFPYQLDSLDNAGYTTNIVSLTENKVYASWFKTNAKIKGKLWDGSSWGSAENVSTSSTTYVGFHSKVGDGDNVHLVFLAADDDLMYVKRIYGSGWSNENEVYDHTIHRGALSIDSGGTLFYFFAETDGDSLLLTTCRNGIWANPIAVGPETDNKVKYGIQTYHQSYSNKIAVIYQTNTTSPYEIRHLYLDGIDHIITENCVAGNDDLTTDNFIFAIEFGENATVTADDNWDVFITVFDSAGNEDNRFFLNQFDIVSAAPPAPPKRLPKVIVYMPSTILEGLRAVSTIQVFGTIYTRAENGQIWCQVLDNEGENVNNATVTVTIWCENWDKFVDDASMTYVTGSRGIYTYDFITPSTYGVYLCDVKATWDTTTAYGSGEFQVTEWAEIIVENIPAILDNLIAHRNAVESTISDIEAYVDTLESGQSTIIGHVDTLESGQSTITGYVDTIETVLGDPTAHGYTDIAHALGMIDNFVDQVEGYTDALESGQTTIQNYVDTLEGGQSTLMGYTDAVESNQQFILDNIDLLKQGQNTIEGYTDTLESGQNTITGYVDQVEGYTDQVEGWVDEIEYYMGVAAMITDGENLYNYLKNTIVPYVDQVEGYTDQVEEYTDTLESGQSTITGHVDTLEEGQTTITDYVDTLETSQATITAQLNWIADYLENTMKPELDSILDNVQNNYTYLSGTIKPQLNAMRENIDKTLDNAVAVYTYLTGTVKPAIDDAYNQAVTNYNYLTDTIKPQLDNIQENLTATAELPENIMDNIFATYSFLTENIKPELDNVYENVNATYSYLINTINPKLDEIAAGVGVALSIEVTRYYSLSAGELQEFYVTIGKGTNVDWVTITLDDPDGSTVVDNASMSNPRTGLYYYTFPTIGKKSGGWLATIVAKDENLTTAYRGVWRLGGADEAVGYLTITVLDNETNEQIEGVKVELYRAGTLVESKYTRWDGKAFLDIMTWDIHELRWSKDGYETETMEIDLAVSSDLTLKIVPTEEKAWAPPIMWILGALIVGGVLTTSVYYGSKKRAKAASLGTAFILPAILLGILWFAGVVG